MCSSVAVDGSLVVVVSSCPIIITVSPEYPKTKSTMVHDAAAVSAIEVFAARAAEKIAKHAAGCELLQRDYLSFILTTLGGVGPPAFVEFLRDSFFHAGLLELLSRHHTGSPTTQGRRRWILSLHLALCRSDCVFRCQMCTPMSL